MVSDYELDLDEIPVGLLLLNHGGAILWANREALNLLAIPQAQRDLPEVPLPNLSHLKERRHLERFFETAAGREEEEEIAFLSSTDQPLLLRLTARESDDGPGWFATLFEHSQVQKLEDHVRVLRNQIRNSHRMEVLGRMTSSLAHDFNNLLTLVVGYSRLLKSKFPEEDSIHQSLGQIQGAGERATGLIDQLLAFGTGQQGGDTPLSVNNLLIDNQNLLQRVISDDLRLHYHLGTAVARTRIETATLQESLIHLLLGCRNEAPRGSAIEVSTRTVKINTSRAEALGLPPGDYVQIALEYHTTGQTSDSPELMERLGLARIREFLTPWGGSVAVTLQREDCLVEIFLPALEDDCRQQAEGHRKTVLVVDDQPELRRFATMVLDQLDAEILSASSTEVALEKARTCGRALDLLVTDVVMPGLDGPALYEKIKLWHPNVKLLLISGHDRHALYRRGIDPSTPILEKPFCPETLRITARSFLASESKVSTVPLREES